MQPMLCARRLPATWRKPWNSKSRQHISAIESWASTAMSEGPDDFSDSFYYRAIRTKIGEALRTLFVPTEPAPERFLKLLLALDRPKGAHNSGMEEKQGGNQDARAPPEEKSARSEGTE